MSGSREGPSVHKQPYERNKEEQTKRGTSRAKSPSAPTSTSVTNSHLRLGSTASAANCEMANKCWPSAIKKAPDHPKLEAGLLLLKPYLVSGFHRHAIFRNRVDPEPQFTRMWNSPMRVSKQLEFGLFLQCQGFPFGNTQISER